MSAIGKFIPKSGAECRVIAAVQDIRLALQGDAPCVDEEHLIGDELGIVLGTTGRDHLLVSPSLWRQSAAQVAQQPGVIRHSAPDFAIFSA